MELAQAGHQHAGLAWDAVRVLAGDAADGKAHAGRQIVNRLLLKTDRLEPLSSALQAIASQRGMDTVATQSCS